VLFHLDASALVKLCWNRSSKVVEYCWLHRQITARDSAAAPSAGLPRQAQAFDRGELTPKASNKPAQGNALGTEGAKRPSGSP
jgi:hypothetical protein